MDAGAAQPGGMDARNVWWRAPGTISDRLCVALFCCVSAAGVCGGGDEMLQGCNETAHGYSRSVTKRTVMWITSHFAGVNDMNSHLMIVRAVPIYASEVYP